MAWPYHFVNLSQEQIAERRKLLDLYGFYAWISPILLLCSVYLVRRLLPRITQNSFHVSHSKARAPLQLNIRRLSWILNSPLPTDFGSLKVHLIGFIYTSWLLVLTIHRTDNDYMHFTKRVGHVAVSQLPFQYLLSIKSPLSPIQLATNLTHETLNPYHRLIGRIIHLYLLAHAALYLNFFYSISALLRRLYDRDVQLGLLSITLLTILAITALPPIRKKAYHRSFYVPHALLSFFLLPAISAHVPYTRKYIFQTLMIYLFNVATRKINTTATATPAVITPVKGTNGALLHISIPAPTLPFGSPIPTHAPGQHIYLKLGHNPKFPRSPFTIASVPPVLPSSLRSGTEKAYRGYPLPDMELVVRNLGGPTTAWLASSSATVNALQTNELFENKHANGLVRWDGHVNSIGIANGSSVAATNLPARARKIDVLVEGPYGSSSSFIPSLLSSFSNPGDHHQGDEQREEVLLLAGGIGATFTLPIYVSLLQSAAAGMTAAATKRGNISHQQQKGKLAPKDAFVEFNSISKRIHFQWIVRSREEAQWGIEYLRDAKAGVQATIKAQGSSDNSFFASREPSQDKRKQQQNPYLPGPEMMLLNVKIYISRNSEPETQPKPMLDDSNRLLFKSKNEEDEKDAMKKQSTPLSFDKHSSRSESTPSPPPSPLQPLPAGTEIIAPSPTSLASQSNSSSSSSIITTRPNLANLIDSVLSPSPPSQEEDPSLNPNTNPTPPNSPPPPNLSLSSYPNPFTDSHTNPLNPLNSTTTTNNTTLSSFPFTASSNSPPTQNQTPNPNNTKITILVCAPANLTTSLHKEVGRHVLTHGRDVSWHAEAFGMGV